MKAGDKVYCIQDYIDCDGEIINSINKKYKILKFDNFYGNENDKTISIITNNGNVNIFWLNNQKFNDSWDDMRENNLFSDYFISERKFKLQKINEKVLEDTK